MCGRNTGMALNCDLKCGICLELFQDPRSLPCLHTFCRECIQRSLNEENHSLKCPVCRAEHELSERAGLLPVNQYALQELPLKRLQQQREDNGGPHQLVECKSCGEQAGPVVAWCEDCDGVICQPCVGQHEKLTALRGHVLRQIKGYRICKKSSVNKCDPSEKRLLVKCTMHVDLELKYWCTCCSELVCSECLLGSHRDHEYSLAGKACHSLKSKMKDLAGSVENKKKEFNWYLEKANEAEGKALEYSELMKSEVNNVFDGIVASVEAQRNEALQSVSQGVKEIWSQKELMEVSLAQLDSFTRFADYTHKCTTDTSYVAMASQGVKLMEQVKNTHGNEATLSQNMISIVPLISPSHVRLNDMFVLGRLSLNFSPAPCSTIKCPRSGIEDIVLIVSFMVEGQSVSSQMLRERCNFLVSGYIEPYINVQYEPVVNQDNSSNVTTHLETKRPSAVGTAQLLYHLSVHPQPLMRQSSAKPHRQDFQRAPQLISSGRQTGAQQLSWLEKQIRRVATQSPAAQPPRQVLPLATQAANRSPTLAYAAAGPSSRAVGRRPEAGLYNLKRAHKQKLQQLSKFQSDEVVRAAGYYQAAQIQRCPLKPKRQPPKCKSRQPLKPKCQSLQTAGQGILAVRPAAESVPLQPFERVSSDDSSEEPDGNIALKLVSCDGGIVQEETAKEENAVGCFTELVEESDELSWIITISVPCLPDYQTLVVRYKMTGIIASETAEVTHKF